MVAAANRRVLRSFLSRLSRTRHRCKIGGAHQRRRRAGCYVDTLTPIPKGKSVHLVLTAIMKHFETTGKVIYTSPGLAWVFKFDQPIDPRQLAVLDRWLEKATVTSSLMGL